MFSNETKEIIKELILKYAEKPISVPDLVDKVHMDLVLKGLARSGHKFKSCDIKTRIKHCLVELIGLDKKVILKKNHKIELSH